MKQHLLMSILAGVMGLCAVAAAGEEFLFSFSVNDARALYFGRSSMASDGYDEAGASSYQHDQVDFPELLPGVVSPYGKFWLRGSGAFERGALCDVKNDSYLRRDMKSADTNASTWVVMLAADYPDSETTVRFEMQDNDYGFGIRRNRLTGSLSLWGEDDTCLVSNMLDTESFQYVVPRMASYQIRYTANAAQFGYAPATPDVLDRTDESYWTGSTAAFTVCSANGGVTLSGTGTDGAFEIFLAGPEDAYGQRTFLDTANCGTVDIWLHDGEWGMSYGLPNLSEEFEDIYILYRMENKGGSAIAAVKCTRPDIDLDSLTVTIAPASCTFSEESLSVTMDKGNPDSQIYYTDDGSDPRENLDGAKLYAGKFMISTTCTIKAVAVLGGFMGNTVTANYVRQAEYTVSTMTNTEGWNLLGVSCYMVPTADAGLLSADPILFVADARTFATATSATDFAAGTAFWLYGPSAAGKRLKLDCIEYPDSAFALKKGWQLCGGDPAVTVTESMQCWRWNGTAYELLPTGERLEAGVGYWIYLN